MQQGPVLRPWLAGVAGYQPGRQAPVPDGRLASNESPTSAAWLHERPIELSDLDLHRYPDPSASRLRGALADLHGVDREQVAVGNGSDELIQLLIQAFAAYTGSIAVAAPGYSLYGLCATSVGADVHRVPLAEWRHDLAAMADLDVDIAFVCNPHNPTGTMVDADDLDTFIARSRARLIVVDEAYIDFATSNRSDLVSEAVSNPRVVVLRTFSKAYALAGVRVGYLVAHRTIAAVVRRLRLPFSVNTAAQEAATQALAHRAQTTAAVDQIIANRTQLERLLHERGLTTVPSQASFVLVLTPEGDRLVDHLARHGIAVRPGTDLGVPDAVRMTVPSQAGLARLDAALHTFSPRQEAPCRASVWSARQQRP